MKSHNVKEFIKVRNRFYIVLAAFLVSAFLYLAISYVNEKAAQRRMVDSIFLGKGSVL